MPPGPPGTPEPVPAPVVQDNKSRELAELAETLRQLSLLDSSTLPPAVTETALRALWMDARLNLCIPKHELGQEELEEYAEELVAQSNPWALSAEWALNKVWPATMKGLSRRLQWHSNHPGHLHNAHFLTTVGKMVDTVAPQVGAPAAASSSHQTTAQDKPTQAPSIASSSQALQAPVHNKPAASPQAPVHHKPAASHQAPVQDKPAASQALQAPVHEASAVQAAATSAPSAATSQVVTTATEEMSASLSASLASRNPSLHKKWREAQQEKQRLASALKRNPTCAALQQSYTVHMRYRSELVRKARALVSQNIRQDQMTVATLSTQQTQLLQQALDLQAQSSAKMQEAASMTLPLAETAQRSLMNEATAVESVHSGE